MLTERPTVVDVARSIFVHLRARLAPYKRIKRLEFAELPKTILGKIRRVELRRLEAVRRGRDERGEKEFLRKTMLVQANADRGRRL